jgi:hypothetical protein
MSPGLGRNLERLLVAGLAVFLVGPIGAEGPEAGTPAPAAPAEAGADANAVWQQRLEQARQRIGQARERESAARAAYSRARHDRNPRGEGLAAIEEERRTAEAELREAEAALPQLVEQARREGVAPGVLEPYWDE